MGSTELRMAAQKALEALELGYDSAKAEADQYHAAMAGYRPQRHAQMDADVQQIAAAITALKAALVEDAMQKFADVNQELMAALAEPENWELRRLREELERCKQVCAATAEAWREEAALGCDHCNSPLYVATRCRVCGRETPIIEPEIKGDNKPVAWIYQNTNTDREYLVWRKSNGGRNWQPLFTAPPQRKPLTEEEIDGLMQSIGLRCADDGNERMSNHAEWERGQRRRIARAIERAHGIGGQL